MAVETRAEQKLTVAKTYDTTTTNGGAATFNNQTTRNLTGSTTPPVTAGGVAEKAMVAGAATIDLAALVCVDGSTINLTGLKPRQWKLKAPSTNGAAITVAKGASNGYTGFGANFSITLLPGAEWQGEDVSTTGPAAVAAGVKTLDLSGTTTDELQIVIAAGT
jgi:hypothetical protein